MLLNLLRRHLFMGLTASALSTTPATKGAIRYRQLWVGADGVTHIDSINAVNSISKDFTSIGGDAALQYVRAFSNSDDFALTGLVVTQQVGENRGTSAPRRSCRCVESSRPPSRHRRDACSMAWRCRFSPLDGASTAASHPTAEISTRSVVDARRQLVHPHERGKTNQTRRRAYQDNLDHRAKLGRVASPGGARTERRERRPKRWHSA